MSKKNDNASQPIEKCAFYEGFGTPQSTPYQLEPRILLDAAAGALMADAVAPQETPTDADVTEAIHANSPEPTQDSSTESAEYEFITAINQQQLDYIEENNINITNVVFIDGNVENPHTLLAQLTQNTAVFYLDVGMDGVSQLEQLLQALSQQSGGIHIEALHLVSHGDEARLSLGSSELTLHSISNEYRQSLENIGAMLSEDADILIYGCNFGEGSAGLAAVNKLAELTQADIAASDDITASTIFGGDAELEVRTGHVSAEQVITEQSMDDYLGVLTIPTGTASTLVNGLGGDNGFGEVVTFYRYSSYNNTYSSPNVQMDDGVSMQIDITGVSELWADGVTFKNADNELVSYTSFSINSNGMIVFGGSSRSFSPSGISDGLNDPYSQNTEQGLPMFAALWADLDNTGTTMTTSEGGTSTGANRAYLSVQDNMVVITWNDYGLYSKGTTPYAFQIILQPGEGNGDINVQFRYEATPALTPPAYTFNYPDGYEVPAKIAAGFNIGVVGGTEGVHYYELPYMEGSSSDLRDIYSDLATRPGATTGVAGIWDFQIVDGVGVSILADSGNLNVGLGSSDAAMNIAAPTDLVGNALAEDDVVITVTGLPTAGTVTYDDGTAVVNGATLTIAQLTSLEYDAPAAYSEPGTFTYSVTRSATTSNAVIDIGLVAAPVIAALDGSLTYTEGDGAVVIDAYASVSDADSTNFNRGNLTVSISSGGVSDEDKLALVATDGFSLSGSTVSHTGTQIGTLAGGTNGSDLVITFNANATTAIVSSLIKHISYQNLNASNPTAVERTIDFVVTDDTGSQSNIASKTITVVSVNDIPVITAGNTLSYSEGDSASAIASGLTLSDADDAELTGATISITGYVNGEDVLGFTNTSSITGTFDAERGVLTLTGDASVASYQAALRSVTYFNTSTDPTTAARTINWAVTDRQDGTNETATSTIDITAIADTPVITTSSSTLTYDEGDGAVVIDATLTLSDTDSATMSGAVITISSGFAAGDVLGFTTQNGITGSYDAATQKLTLTGNTTVAHYQTALQSITFTNNSEDLASGTRTISWVVTDSGSVASVAASSAIQYLSVNDAPTLADFNEDSLAYTQGDDATVIDSSVTVADVDSTDFNGGTLTVTLSGDGTGENSGDVLSVVHDAAAVSVTGSNLSYGGVVIGSISGGTNGNELIITFNDNASIAAVQAAFRQVAYQNIDVDTPSAAARSVSFVLTDGDGGTSASVSKDIVMTLVNSAPVISDLNGTLNYTEGDGAVVLDADASVADLDSANFDTGTLTVSIATNRVELEDVLSINNVGTGSGQISVSGSSISYQNTVIATFTGGATTNDLVITFNSSANAEAISALIKQITYQNTNTDDPSTATRVVNFVLTDGDGGTSLTSSKNVMVAAVNDAPVINDVGDTLAYTEGDGAQIIDSDASVSDVDSDDFDTGSLTVSFSAGGVAAEDILSINHQGSAAGQIGVSDSSISYEGTTIATFSGGSNGESLVITFNEEANATNVSALLKQLSYQNIDNDNPTAADRTVSMVFKDGDGATSEVATKTIEVSSVNDAPTLSGIGGLTNYASSDNAIIVIPDATTVTVADVDSTHFNGGDLTVSLGDTSEDSEDVLALSAGNNISFSGNDVSYSGTQIGTFTGGSSGADLVITFNSDSATPEAVSALIKQITYQNIDGSTPTAGKRVISFVLTDSDGGASSEAATYTINNAPSINLAAGRVNYDEEDVATVIDSTATVNTSDNLYNSGSDPAVAGTLSVSITAGENSTDDALSILPSENITLENGNVKYDDTVIGVYEGGSDGEALVITFNADATDEAATALIKQIAYQNTNSDNPTEGARTITFAVTDGNGASSTSAKTLEVFGVNDVPTMTVSGLAPAFTEGGAAIQIDSGFTVADVDSANFAGGNLTVAITADGTATEDVLSVAANAGASMTIEGAEIKVADTTIGTISGGSNGQNLVITFNSNATAAVVQAVAQQITYQNTNTDNPSDASRTVSFTLTDGDGGSSAAVSKTVAVTPVNDIPVINDLNGTLAYTEGDGALVIDAGASVLDVDSTDFNNGTLTVTFASGGVSGEDVLAIAASGDITIDNGAVSYSGTQIGTVVGGSSGANLVITFNSSANATNVSALIKQITYQNTNTDDPSGAERTVSFVLADGDGGSSQTSSKTITVATVNDAPTISAFVTTVAYTEGDGAVVLDSAVSLADVDSADFATGSLTVTISNNGVITEDILSIQTGDSIAVSGKTISYSGNAIATFSGGSQGKPLVITFNSNAMVVAVDALIEKITYKNINTDAPNTDARTLNFSLSDGDGATSNLGDVTVEITAVNNAPTIENLEGTVQFNEGGSAIVIDSDASVADVDSANFDTGTLTVSISANRVSTEDVLSINSVGTNSGEINVSGSDIYYGGGGAANKIGQFVGGTSTNDLVITFNANADATGVSALIKQITYQNTNDTNPNAAERTIAFTLTDGDGATSVVSSKQVQIIEVNNPPVIALASEVTFIEGGLPVVLDDNASISDVDSSTFYRGALTVSITVGGVDTQDVLSVNHVGTSAGQIGVSGSSITYGDEIIGNMVGGREGADLEISFTSKATQDAVNALVKQITYVNTNANNPTTADRTIEMVVTDDGGGESDPVNITLSITPVNDAPVMTAGATMTFVEGSVAKVIDSTISLSDVDDTHISGATVSISAGLTADDLLSFTNTDTITGRYSDGVLTLTGTDTIASYEAALRSVKYSTSNDDPTASGANRTISWQVTDANAADIGAQSSTIVTSTIEITAVNDASVLTGGGVLAYTEGDSASVIDSTLTLMDADDTEIVSATVTIGTGFTNGDVLSFSNTASITGSYNAANGTLTLTGSDTVANYQAALRAVTFSSSSQDPTTDSTSRTILWQVTDANSDLAGAQDSNNGVSIINITAVNDAPTLTVDTSGALWSFTEGDAAQVIDDSILLSDVDDTIISRAQISISTGFLAGDILSFEDTDTISGSYNASTGVLTLLGDDSLANYQTALRSVKYSTISEDPAKFEENRTRTFSWQVTDADSDKVGAATSLSVSNTINIIEVNDIAVITGDAIRIPFNDRAANLFRGLIAEDLEDGDITSSIEIINNPIVYDRGADYQVTYRVTDADNESVEFTRTVTVEFADDVARIFVAEGKTPIVNGASDVSVGALLTSEQQPISTVFGATSQSSSSPMSSPMPDAMVDHSLPVVEGVIQVQASNDAQYYNADNTYDVLGNDSLQGSEVKVTLLENVNGQWQETDRIENEHGVWTIENNKLKFIPHDQSVKLNEVMTQKYRVYKANANDNFDDAELTIKPQQGSMNQLPLFDQNLYEKLAELTSNEPFEVAELITMEDFLQLSFAEQVQQLHKVKH